MNNKNNTKRDPRVKLDPLGKQTRITEKTLILIRMYAGELQRTDGVNRTDDRAIFELFQQCRPDLIEDFTNKYPHYSSTEQATE